MMIRQVASLAIPCCLLALATACTAAPPTDPAAERRDATPSAPPSKTAAVPPTETPASTPPPEPASLRLPGMEAGTITVLKAGPRKGSMVVGDVPPGKDELWVLFRCRGEGKAEIILEPGIDMPFTCLDDVISPIMNRLDLGRRKTLTVRVQAPDSVEWALRVTR
ncbi:hypothetical protein ACIA8R_50415 [Nonomuraea sp. NPDC051191]|uniref:hypothetical protein n=1 Tax=Nonomuraea sp. NPDC051191 TaxID=3364372 RepID=UPI0037B8621A